MRSLFTNRKKHICDDSSCTVIVRAKIQGPFTWTEQAPSGYRYVTTDSVTIRLQHDGDAFLSLSVCTTCKEAYIGLYAAEYNIPYEAKYLSGLMDAILMRELRLTERQFLDSVDWAPGGVLPSLYFDDTVGQGAAEPLAGSEQVSLDM